MPANFPVREPDLIELFARPLHAAQARYLVAGSLGAMLYGEPRLTLVMDLAVVLPAKQLAEMPAIFSQPEFYCPSIEVLEAEIKRECRAHFNVIHVPSGLKADFYPAASDPFFAWSWEHRREATHRGGTIFYAPPEYILVWKTVYYAEGGGEKHIRDVNRMLDISGDEIDITVVSAELDRRGLRGSFEQMRRAT